MNISPYRLHRLAEDQVRDRHAEAVRNRSVRLARIASERPLDTTAEPGPLGRLRVRAADRLVELAARLSPTHRDVLCAVRPSTCTPAHG